MGTPTLGHIWDKNCHRAVGKAGLCPISNWPYCPFHDKLKLFLVVYADGFRREGPSANLAVARALPRALLQLEDPAPVHLYLGCLHEQREATTPTKATARAIVHSMVDYLGNTVATYCDLVRGITGKPLALRQVSTPFLLEDHKDAPASMPIRGGPYETCPWCRHTFSPGSTVSPAAGAGSPRKKESGRTVSPSAGTGTVGLAGGKKRKGDATG